jgi:hypothetical protein
MQFAGALKLFIRVCSEFWQLVQHPDNRIQRLDGAVECHRKFTCQISCARMRDAASGLGSIIRVMHHEVQLQKLVPYPVRLADVGVHIVDALQSIEYVHRFKGPSHPFEGFRI